MQGMQKRVTYPQVRTTRRLTSKQKAVYEFIRGEIERGQPPTHTEIQRHFNWKTVSTVQQVVGVLIDRGYLEKKGNTWRGLSIPTKKFDFPPSEGYYWYYPSQYAARKPVEIVRNGVMEMEQLEPGRCIRTPCKGLVGKWEALSKNTEMENKS